MEPKKEKKGFQPTIPVRTARLATTQGQPTIPTLASRTAVDAGQGLVDSPLASTQGLGPLLSVGSSGSAPLPAPALPASSLSSILSPPAGANPAASKPKFAPTIPARRKKPQEDPVLVPDDIVLEQERKPREPRGPKDRDPTKRKPQDAAPVRVAFMGTSQGITKNASGIGSVRMPITTASGEGNSYDQFKEKNELDPSLPVPMESDAKSDFKGELFDSSTKEFRPVFVGEKSGKTESQSTGQSTQPFQENGIYFFQFPTALPARTIVQKPFHEAFEPPTQVEYSATSIEPKNQNNLASFPPGIIGKVKVYRSGKIKMFLGENSFDITPGSSCSFYQKVMALSASKREAVDIGELDSRFLCVPNIDELLG